jgi:hypothetical protein
MRVIACCLLAAVLGATETVPTDIPILAAARTAARAAQTARVTFSLTRHLALFDEPVVSTGVLEMDRVGRRVRWEFSGELVLILTDDRLRRWDGRGTEETIDDGDPGAVMLRRQMEGLLDGDWSALAEIFTFATGGGPGQVTLTPRVAELAEVVSRIELIFDPASAALRTLAIHTPAGDRTEYAFAMPVVGEPIPDPRFAGP